MNDDNTILLVEDNPDDEELTRLAFERSGCSSHLDVVRDGAEALDYLFAAGAWTDRAGRLPRLVLLDLNLPRIGGLDVLRRLRAEPRTRLIPVVIHTSSVSEQDIIRGYDLGCNSYIRKQMDFSRFSAAIRMLLHYWMLVNESPTRSGRAV